MDQFTKPRVSDYYADLELSQQANARDIKRAFHRLARKYHPDKKAPGKSVDAYEFRKVREAYECLIDAAKRAAYDARYFDLCDQWTRYKQWENYQRKDEERRQAEEEQRAARKRAEQERKAAEAERMRRMEQERRAAEEKAENERIRREKERQAEERSREAAQRARERQEEAARERIRREKVREAERRSEEAAKKIRIEQELAAQERLRAILIEEKQQTARRSWAQMREEADRRQAANRRRTKPAQPAYTRLNECFHHPDLGWVMKNGPANCVFCGVTRVKWSFRCPECSAPACPTCKARYCLF
ncbi:DnaJ-domain-containing protein [Annulohypoxylon truncatum]|uniref:DnaJ-domain-containing protein n=1 Tax=Annulohypoxylon truncatum TaxID=327061 RepID=UPI0020076C2E|nr:DnaJ-domain-containing protein [Annulohypoxylon truncatum]KAI1204463.1 DnaJ-domain-containing protein [Annulohypoxylon truncatum]